MHLQFFKKNKDCKKRLIYFDILLAAPIPVIFCIIIIITYLDPGGSSSLEYQYNQLEIGMTQEEVIEIVGEPENKDSTNLHWIYFEDNSKQDFSLKFSQTTRKLIKIGEFRK